MTINVSWFNESTRALVCKSVEVRRRAFINGHSIFIDDDYWYYVRDNYGCWQYFGSIREARKFIRDTYWG